MRWLAVVVAFGCAAAAVAQEPVAFRPYAYKLGDVVRATKTEDEVTTITAPGGGKTVSTERFDLEYTTEVTAVGPDPTRPAKLLRTYTKAARRQNDKPAPDLFPDAKTVTIERAGPRYEFRVGGNVPSGFGLGLLEHEFNKRGGFSPALLPPAALRPGDTWDASRAYFGGAPLADLPPRIDLTRSKVTGKYLKAETIRGAPFADLELTVTFVVDDADARWATGWRATACADGSWPDLRYTRTTAVRFGSPTGDVDLRRTEVYQSERTHPIKR